MVRSLTKIEQSQFSALATNVYAMLLAFYEVYLTKNEDYRPYLHASYFQTISQGPL